MSWRSWPKTALLPLTLAILAGASLGAADDPLVVFGNYLFKGIADRNAQLSDQEKRVKAFDQANPNLVILLNGGAWDWTFGVVPESDPLNQKELSGGKAMGTLKAAKVIYSASANRYLLDAFTSLGSDGTVVLPYGATEIAIAPDSPAYARVIYLQDRRGQRIYLTYTPNSTGKAPVIGLTRTSYSLVMTPMKGKLALEFADPATKNRVRIGVDQLPDPVPPGQAAP